MRHFAIFLIICIKVLNPVKELYDIMKSINESTIKYVKGKNESYLITSTEQLVI